MMINNTVFDFHSFIYYKTEKIIFFFFFMILYINNNAIKFYKYFINLYMLLTLFTSLSEANNK